MGRQKGAGVEQGRQEQARLNADTGEAGGQKRPRDKSSRQNRYHRNESHALTRGDVSAIVTEQL